MTPSQMTSLETPSLTPLRACMVFPCCLPGVLPLPGDEALHLEGPLPGVLEQREVVEALGIGTAHAQVAFSLRAADAWVQLAHGRSSGLVARACSLRRRPRRRGNALSYLARPVNLCRHFEFVCEYVLHNCIC